MLAARPTMLRESRKALSCAPGSVPVSTASRTPRWSARWPERGQRRGEGPESLRVVLGRHRADPGEDEVRAQLVGQGEGGIGTADPLVELVGRVERPAGGQAEGDERELDRAKQVAKVAAARLAQPLRGQVADRVDHHAPGAHPGGLVNLVADRVDAGSSRSPRGWRIIACEVLVMACDSESLRANCPCKRLWSQHGAEDRGTDQLAGQSRG